jgi:hypothetical protein
MTTIATPINDQSTSGLDVAPQVGTINPGELLEDLSRIKKQRAELTATDSDLSKQESAIKAKLLSYHAATGLSQLSSDKLTVSFRQEMRVGYVPEKWEDLMKWAVDGGYGYIFQRRLSDSKVMDLVQSGVPMPDGFKFDPYVDVSVVSKRKTA